MAHLSIQRKIAQGGGIDHNATKVRHDRLSQRVADAQVKPSAMLPRGVHFAPLIKHDPAVWREHFTTGTRYAHNALTHASS